MQVEKTREILKLFERAAVEHLAWLMRVHSALMFPEAAPLPPCSPEGPLAMLAACACGEVEDLGALRSLHDIMHAQAFDLIARSRAEGGLDAQSYGRFMAIVDAYAREARRVEGHFRRLLVETDPLTGVNNRQGMMRDLRREWTRAFRTGQPVCVALADLDHFKRVNDTWGHDAGDRVLCAAAKFFKRRLRPYDTVYRYGGEEFLFCLPGTDTATAHRVLDRLRKAMGRLSVMLEDGSRIAVTCSIGFAQMVPGRSVHEAVTAADRALYVAKGAGRNRVEQAPPLEGDASPAPELVIARLHPDREAARGG